MSTSAMSAPRSSSSALRNQDGRIDSWSIVPPTMTGGWPGLSSCSWNARVLGWPRQNRLRGLTPTLANAAVPGSATTLGGLISNATMRSGSSPVMVALSGMLPRLSTARSCVAPVRPRDVRGASSALVSAKAPIWRTPSSTTEPCRVLLRRDTDTERHRTGGHVRAARRPERDADDCPRPPGTARRPAARPPTRHRRRRAPAIVNWSTTVPLLRTRISALACAPGATATDRGPEVGDGTHGRAV